MGIIPKNPQTLHHFHPQNSPIILLGILGDETPKNSEIELIPFPKKSPNFVQALSPSPPHPWNLGQGRGKSGIRALLYHTIFDLNMKQNIQYLDFKYCHFKIYTVMLYFDRISFFHTSNSVEFLQTLIEKLQETTTADEFLIKNVQNIRKNFNLPIKTW